MQRDDASVAITEHALDCAIRSEPREAVRLLETQTTASSGHAESMTGFCPGSRPLSPRLSKGESSVMLSIPPTRFHEEPKEGAGRRLTNSRASAAAATGMKRR
jgi:hypothetical protein